MNFNYDEIRLIYMILNERKHELIRNIGKTTDEAKLVELSQLVAKTEIMVEIAKRQQGGATK